MKIASIKIPEAFEARWDKDTVKRPSWGVSCINTIGMPLATLVMGFEFAHKKSMMELNRFPIRVNAWAVRETTACLCYGQINDNINRM